MTLSLSLATFCRPNSSFVFDFLQHHVQIRHKRNYNNQKAVVVEEASLTLALPIKWEMQEYANVENGSQRHR